MKYLFFDIECANCLNGEGKICSFGYVLTDENFNVLKKRDIIINPKAPFLLGNGKNGNGIKLAYPLFRFDWAHTFPYYYQEIRRLLLSKDHFPIGFADDQDINFLLYTCKRYNLPTLYFDYLDVQSLDMVLSSSTQPRGLSFLIESFGLEKGVCHKSDEDALMTMEILSRLVSDSKMNLSKLIKQHPQVVKSVDQFIKNKKLQVEKKKKLQHVKDMLNDLYQSDPNKINLEKIDQHFFKKTIFIKPSVFYSKPILLEEYAKYLKEKGFIFLKTLNKAPDYYICGEKDDTHTIKVNFHHSRVYTFNSFIAYLKKSDIKEKTATL